MQVEVTVRGYNPILLSEISAERVPNPSKCGQESLHIPHKLPRVRLQAVVQPVAKRVGAIRVLLVQQK